MGSRKKVSFIKVLVLDKPFYKFNEKKGGTKRKLINLFYCQSFG